MTQEKTGGAAFPITEQNSSNRICLVSHGMTLLDYFAAKALPEVLHGMKVGFTENNALAAAKYSYILASAMIEERKKYTNQ